MAYPGGVERKEGVGDLEDVPDAHLVPPLGEGQVFFRLAHEEFGSGDPGFRLPDGKQGGPDLVADGLLQFFQGSVKAVGGCPRLGDPVIRQAPVEHGNGKGDPHAVIVIGRKARARELC